MKKSFSIVLLATLSFTSMAQAETLEELAQKVRQLVSTNSGSLDSEEELTVRRNLRQIINIYRGNHQTTNNSYICNSNDNTLHDVDAGRLIYDFSSSTDCQNALKNLKIGKGFCDSNDNTFYSTSGRLVHDFSDSTSCAMAVESVYKYNKFCDSNDNTLRNGEGRLLFDFSSSTDCNNAIVGQ